MFAFYSVIRLLICDIFLHRTYNYEFNSVDCLPNLFEISALHSEFSRVHNTPRKAATEYTFSAITILEE